MAIVMVKRDLLTIDDINLEEVIQLIDLGLKIKRGIIDVSKDLNGKIMAMIFQKPSTRTRVSFEVAMIEMGGHALYLGWDQLQLGRGETIADTARVLSRYVDIIMARVYRHADIAELSKYSSIPVINGLSDLYHPVQILSDLLTIQEVFGKLKGLKLAFIGDGSSNVCHSLLLGCTKVGIDISVATPKEFPPNRNVLNKAYDYTRLSGSYIKVTDDPHIAAKDADIIYTDTFVSMGFEEEREKRIRIFIPRYQVTKNIMSKANSRAVFMHCLPAHRGEEVSDEVIDGDQSIVWDQAENRLHMQKAILRWLLADV
jgi:ornithine carbamoyltransferase